MHDDTGNQNKVLVTQNHYHCLIPTVDKTRFDMITGALSAANQALASPGECFSCPERGVLERKMSWDGESCI